VEDLFGGEALGLSRLGQEDVAPPLLARNQKALQLLPKELQPHLPHLQDLSQDPHLLVPGVAHLPKPLQKAFPGIGPPHLKDEPPGPGVLGEGA
jgi:hypothetical protein